MTTDHDRYAQWGAAYTLGALDTDDRRDFERHLAACATCAAELAALAPLPALIGRVEAADVEHGQDPELTRSIGAAARNEQSALHRRTRLWQILAGAWAAAAILLALLLIWPGDTGSDSATQAASIVRSTAAVTDVAVAEKGWGTEIILDIGGLPLRDRYQLWTVDSAGEWVPAATWSPTPSGGVRLVGASGAPTIEVMRIVITSAKSRDDVLVEASI